MLSAQNPKEECDGLGNVPRSLTGRLSYFLAERNNAVHPPPLSAHNSIVALPLKKNTSWVWEAQDLE